MRSAGTFLFRMAFLACLGGGAWAAPFSFPLGEDGTVLAYLVVGPFSDSQRPGQAVLTAGLPREGAEIQGMRWQFVLSGPDGIVDLTGRWRREGAVAYAACVIDSPQTQRATVRVRGAQTMTVWLAGREVFRTRRPRDLSAEEKSFPVLLSKGPALLVAEVGHTRGAWGFKVQLRPDKAPFRTTVELLRNVSRLTHFAVDSFPFMVGERQNPTPAVHLRFHYLGERRKALLRVETAGSPPETGASQSQVVLKPGWNAVPAPAPSVSKPTKVTVSLTAGGEKVQAACELTPCEPFEIFVVQHTHTDIGYTADQPVVLREHLRFIDEALAYIDATRDFPPDARLKWVCEVNWGPLLYLRSRPPEAVRRLKEAARKGLIEFTALGLNMTDVANEEVIIRSLLPVRRFRREGIEVVSAMQNDVNGFPWALPRLLRSIGVRYFANGINQTRSKVPFNFPCALWWESPDGSPLLTWRGPHYMTGNFLGLGGKLAEAERKLGPYLRALISQKYPHRRILIPISGQFTDNAPPTVNVCKLIKAWNEKWTYPHLRTSTLKEFFSILEREEGTRLPHLRKAWCDWWADGIGAGADELALVKASQESLAVTDRLVAVAGFGAGPQGAALRRDLREAYLTALFFDEHTYGAANSISDPGSLRAKHGWLFKASFSASLAWQSARLEDAAASGLLYKVPTGEDPVVLVFNPLPWKRACALRMKLPTSLLHSLWPYSLVGVSDGRELPYQTVGRTRTHREIAALVPDVPGCGYRTFRVVRKRPSEPGVSPFTFPPNGISNGIVTVKVDPGTGELSLVKIGGAVLTPESAEPYGFGRYIYERIVKPQGRRFLWPRHPSVPFERTAPRDIQVRPVLRGPQLASLRVEGRIAEKHTVRCDIYLWHSADWVELYYRLRKERTVEPEAGYIAFPFREDLMPLRAEVVGGLMEPGKDQIPRSASDWHSIQDYVVAGSGALRAVWVTHDAPLVQFGGINTGKYRDLVEVKRPLFYSWLFNNYWFTNFPAEQGGEFLFRYSVGRASGDAQALRFARERALRPRAFALPPRREGVLPPDSAFFLKGNEHLAAFKVAEDGNGIILRFRNLQGAPAEGVAEFSELLSVSKIQGVTILEEPCGVEVARDGRVLRVPLGPNQAVDLRCEVKLR